MKLSLEWLKQYVDIPNLTPEEIAHRLTMATAEVDSSSIKQPEPSEGFASFETAELVEASGAAGLD